MAPEPCRRGLKIPSYTWTRPDAIVYPGGGRREYSYDPLMRVTQILAKDPDDNSVLDSSYSYDSIGNILNKTDCTDARPCVSTSYTCDDVGNRLNQDGVEGAWSYNENNELLTFADTEYRYDANGNATQLLRSLSGVAGSGAVMFTSHDNYDPFGRRLWKEVGGVRTYFIYSDEGLIAEYDVSGTELRSYSYTANGLFLDFYNLPESHEINRVSRFKKSNFYPCVVYKPDSTWTTDPLWLKTGSQYYFYHNDHLGTPQKSERQGCG